MAVTFQDTKTDDALSNNKKNKIFDSENKEDIALGELHEMLTSSTSKNDAEFQKNVCLDKMKKAYLDACELDDSMINSMTETPRNSLQHLAASISENIGVHNLPIDYREEEGLSDLEASLFSLILQEASDVLQILRGTLEMGPKPKKDVDLKSPTRITMRPEDKCSAEDEMEMFFGEDAGLVPVVPSTRDKLLKNRDLVYKVFCNIASELEHYGIYDCLRQEVNTIIESKEQECNLKINSKMLSELAVKLQNLYDTFEEKFEAQRKQYLQKANKLTEEIDRSYCENIEKLDYIMRWEDSKLEQLNLRLSLEEEKVNDQIKELEKERTVDAKVSEELRFYGNSVVDSYEDDIISWSTRFNEEMERRQMETTELEERIAAMKEFLEDSYELKKTRQKVVDKDLEEKQKIEDEKEYWRSVNESATIIQALWRGYMVRHKLGEYADLGRKKKNSKKKSKKKKK